jgi:hypothetical protein
MASFRQARGPAKTRPVGRLPWDLAPHRSTLSPPDSRDVAPTLAETSFERHPPGGWHAHRNPLRTIGFCQSWPSSSEKGQRRIEVLRWDELSANCAGSHERHFGPNLKVVRRKTCCFKSLRFPAGAAKKVRNRAFEVPGWATSRVAARGCSEFSKSATSSAASVAVRAYCGMMRPILPRQARPVKGVFGRARGCLSPRPPSTPRDVEGLGSFNPKANGLGVATPHETRSRVSGVEGRVSRGEGPRSPRSSRRAEGSRHAQCAVRRRRIAKVRKGESPKMPDLRWLQTSVASVRQCASPTQVSCRQEARHVIPNRATAATLNCQRPLKFSESKSAGQ